MGAKTPPPLLHRAGGMGVGTLPPLPLRGPGTGVRMWQPLRCKETGTAGRERGRELRRGVAGGRKKGNL